MIIEVFVALVTIIIVVAGTVSAAVKKKQWPLGLAVVIVLAITATNATFNTESHVCEQHIEGER